MKAVIRGVVPSKSNSYRIARNRLFKTKIMSAYEEAFKWQFPKQKEVIDTEHAVHLVVYYDNKRSDLDGSFKAILDCLQKAAAIRNDNKTVVILAEKLIDKNDPRVEIEVRAIPSYDYLNKKTDLNHVLFLKNN